MPQHLSTAPFCLENLFPLVTGCTLTGTWIIWVLRCLPKPQWALSCSLLNTEITVLNWPAVGLSREGTQICFVWSRVFLKNWISYQDRKIRIFYIKTTTTTKTSVISWKYPENLVLQHTRGNLEPSDSALRVLSSSLAASCLFHSLILPARP